MQERISAFQLPLGPDEFRSALQKGQGRALMHITEHGAFGLEELISDACLQDQSYDPQCECGRAEWLIEMVDAADVADLVMPRIRRALAGASPSGNYWDQNLLCQLALIFAQRGHGKFRSSLYSALYKHEHSADIIAGEQIIQLDGADGLLFVAERAGQWLVDDPEMYVGNFLMSFYDETHEVGAAERILRAAAGRNALIAAYLDRVDADDDSNLGQAEFKAGQGTIRPDMVERFGIKGARPSEPWRTWSSRDVIQDIEATEPSENRHRHLYRRWGRNASDQELRDVAEAMFAQGIERRWFFFLHVFQSRGLPEVDDRVLQRAESDDEQVRWIVYHVLADHAHPAVRRLAVDRISAGRMIEGELRLLRNNYVQGDWAWISTALRLPSDDDELHSIVLDLLHVFGANRAEEAFGPMMLVYERSPCANCRGDAAKVLHRIGKLPSWVREECRYDVDADTRDSAGEP